MLGCTAKSVSQKATRHRFSKSTSKRLYDTRKRHISPVLVEKRGMNLIHDPFYNKGTGFPIQERDRLALRGLVPPAYLDSKLQVDRVMKRYQRLEDPLEKYQFLQSLQDRNETLFYKILINNISMLAPIVYTPTVGLACQQFSGLFRMSRGMYFSAEDSGQMASMVYNWPENDVDVIVVTDGSRVLGLGDLGVNGVGISIGKLALYVAAGGIHPHKCLPVVIDVGTNNQKLLDDPLYIGLAKPRVDGAEYFELVDEFMRAVTMRWPDVLIQFEDFSNDHALSLLEKYRYKYLCFNDDIQGTGSVTLSGVVSALKTRSGSYESLASERIVVVGAGSAGLGVTNAIAWTMVTQLGVRHDEAFKQFYLVDNNGLLGQGRAFNPAQMRYIRSDLPDRMGLLDLVKEVKPTIILGVTGVSGLFTEEVIREMYKHCERPIIFPLSNPTSKAECTAEQAYTWTDGNAIVASGSPFEPVEVNGKTCIPSQCNNMYIFPGLGLAAISIKAKRISYNMINKAGLALVNSLTMEERQLGLLYPRISRIRQVSHEVAVAVARAAFSEKLAGISEPADLEKFIADAMYIPEYAPLIFREDL